MQETWIQSLGQEDLLEKEMATDSSILAWRIPWTEEPGRIQPGSRKSQTRLSAHAHTMLVMSLRGGHHSPHFMGQETEVMR